MADSEQKTPQPEAATRPYTWRAIAERFLESVCGLLGSRRRQNDNPSVKRHSSKPTSTRSRPRHVANGINRRENLRAQRQKLMPFLSNEHRHLQHDKCFASHLVDAVRLFKLFTRLEEEQQESEQLVLDSRAKALDASMQTGILQKIEGNNEYLLPFIAEHEASLKQSLENIEKWTKSDVERKAKLSHVEKELNSTMNDLSVTVDEYQLKGEPFPISTDFVIALRRCIEASRQLRDSQTEHVAATFQKSSQQAHPAAEVGQSPGETRTPTSPVGTYHRLNASRQLHRLLQQRFLRDHAVNVVGGSGDLPHDLTIENLARFTSQQKALPQSDRCSTDPGVERRSQRDIDGRPLDNGTPLLPPVHDELQQIAADYHQTKLRYDRSYKKLQNMKQARRRSYAAVGVAYATTTLRSCEKSLMYEGRPLAEAEEELRPVFKAQRQEHMISARRMIEALYELPRVVDLDLQPNNSDWNCDSEAPGQRAAEISAVNPREIRRWHRNIGRQQKLDQDEAAPKPSSSNGPPWDDTWHLDDGEEDDERKRRWLQTHTQNMEELRLQVETVRRAMNRQ